MKTSLRGETTKQSQLKQSQPKDCFATVRNAGDGSRNDGRKIWQFPWRYKESVAFVGGIVAVGLVLQLSAGAFNYSLLQWPANIIFGGFILLFLLLLSLQRKNPIYQWFSGVPMAVTLIGALVILGVIMGLTPQVNNPATASDPVSVIASDSEAIFSRLGFTSITSSWPFVLVYFITLLSLGMLIIRRLLSSCVRKNQPSLRGTKQSISGRLKNYAFYLNHIGLWILLFAAGMGAADIKRYVMHVREGETEWRVYNSKGEVLDLPVAIKLNDFYMEEYPPKLTVIDRETGAPQPEDHPAFFQVDDQQPEGKIGNWDISLKQYIHQAVRNSDSTYHEVHMPGASPAAKVEIRDPKTGVQKEGWVCTGNIAQLYMVLNLDEKYCLAMTRPEPKRFVSDIDVYSEDGKQAHTLLEVNKPYKLGYWMLYQYGYDSDAGNMSTYSSIELVYDPWVVPVYVGIILLACGSLCLLWIGNKRKEVCDDME